MKSLATASPWFMVVLFPDLGIGQDKSILHQSSHGLFFVEDEHDET